MDTGMVVSDELSRTWLRHVHITRMGKPVVAGDWLSMVPNETFDELMMFDGYDDKLDLHHLWLVFPVWGLFRTRLGKQVVAVSAWRCAEGDTVRFGAEMAASLYERELKRPAACAMVTKLPKGAAERFCVDVWGTQRDLRLETAGWVAPRYVVVC